MSKYIAILDSGIGGVTVLRALKTLIPGENFLYIADSAHIPYGNKSKDEILALSIRIIQWLNTQPIKLIVLACNTTDTNAFETLGQISNVPIFGISGAIIKMLHNDKNKLAMTQSGDDSTYIFTTLSTYRSLAFQSIGTNVMVIPCLEFASLIEKLPVNSLILRDRIIECLSLYIYLPFNNVKKLIYGCTHYPLIHHIIKEIFTDANIIDPSFYLAEMVADSLSLHTSRIDGSDLEYYVTGDPDIFYIKLQEIAALYNNDWYVSSYPKLLNITK